MILLSDLTQDDILSIQALMKGTASQSQQQHALVFILNKACLLNVASYIPGGPDCERETRRREGQQFAGHIIKQCLDDRIELNKLPGNKPTEKK